MPKQQIIKHSDKWNTTTAALYGGVIGVILVLLAGGSEAQLSLSSVPEIAVGAAGGALVLSMVAVARNLAVK